MKKHVKPSAAVDYLPAALGYFALIVCVNFELQLSHVLKPGLGANDLARISAFAGAVAGLVIYLRRGRSGVLNLGTASSILVFFWAMFGFTPF